MTFLTPTLTPNGAIRLNILQPLSLRCLHPHESRYIKVIFIDVLYIQPHTKYSASTIMCGFTDKNIKLPFFSCF